MDCIVSHGFVEKYGPFLSYPNTQNINTKSQKYNPQYELIVNSIQSDHPKYYFPSKVKGKVRVKSSYKPYISGLFLLFLAKNNDDQ